MANLKFRQSGLRILDSRAGDLLIVDPRLEMQLMFTAEFLKLAETDEVKMAWLGKRFLQFIEKHTEVRWQVAEKELAKIAHDDYDFSAKLLNHFDHCTIDDLRKIEKEIYFWKLKNGKIKAHEKNN